MMYNERLYKAHFVEFIFYLNFFYQFPSDSTEGRKISRDLDEILPLFSSCNNIFEKQIKSVNSWLKLKVSSQENCF